MKKIVYIVSDIEKALAFEWLSVALKQNFELIFILIGKDKTALMLFLQKHGIQTYYVNGAVWFVSQWWSVLKILKKERPATIHTHMWTANLIGLSTAWLLGIKKRIFTRHHAMIHYSEYPSGQKWDKLCNWLATDIVAISENIKSILTKFDGATKAKIHIIHHGFDLSYFRSVERERITALRKKYSIEDIAFPIIGVIARYTKWKGIQFIIEAFKNIKEEYPNALLILANAEGDYKQTIQHMLQDVPVGCYKEIIFEEDLSGLYKLFNVYVHVPTDGRAEAFGQTYVEALASGIPSVFTLSGIANEFIVHEKNALVVGYENSPQIFESIRTLINDKTLVDKLKEQGQLSVGKFSFDKMLMKLEILYA